MKAHVSFDPYNVADFDIIVKTVSHCLRLIVHRAMGILMFIHILL
jgi:hypothetical protein